MRFCLPTISSSCSLLRWRPSAVTAGCGSTLVGSPTFLRAINGALTGAGSCEHCEALRTHDPFLSSTTGSRIKHVLGRDYALLSGGFVHQTGRFLLLGRDALRRPTSKPKASETSARGTAKSPHSIEHSHTAGNASSKTSVRLAWQYQRRYLGHAKLLRRRRQRRRYCVTCRDRAGTNDPVVSLTGRPRHRYLGTCQCTFPAFAFWH